MTKEEMYELHGLLHTLWSKSVGLPGYDKRDWGRLEALIGKAICTILGPEAAERGYMSMIMPEKNSHKEVVLTETNRPRWTVCYNIVSPESDRWVGRGWEFFDEECHATACYLRHQKIGNCPTKRPYYHQVDYQHLGAAHHFWMEKEAAEGKKP